MRYATAAIVLVAAALMIQSRLLRPGAGPAGDPDGGPAAPVLVVAGNHTLESLAAAVGDPEVLSYDPAARTAVCRRSLRIEGALVLGDAAQPNRGVMLEMATEKCGALTIEVMPTGTLALYGSTLTTVDKVVSGGSCPKGYGLTVAGRLVMVGSNMDFMSGTMSESLLAGSSAEIRNSSIVRGDGACLRFVDPPADKYVLEGSVFGAANPWALDVTGNAAEPRTLTVRDCRFNAQFGPVNNLSRAVTVDLIDCNLGRSAKLSVARGDARTRVRWTVSVVVRLRRADGSTTPAGGLQVRVESLSSAGAVDADADADATAVTDGSGGARVVATQWVATGERHEPPPAAAGPTHQITVFRNGAPAARHELAVAGKGAQARLELPE